tara:strand:+ start:11308 stop:11568 length:261 start_codon:yes stop_codon:yes gene_type:complete
MTSILQPLSDKEIKTEVARQLGREHEVRKIHVSLVRGGDTVFHDGKVKTVCFNDVGYDSFMGHKLFGDSYVLGRKPVQRIVMGAGA